MVAVRAGPLGQGAPPRSPITNSPPTHSPCWTPRRPHGRCSSGSPAVPPGPCIWPPPNPSASRASWPSRRPAGWRSPAPTSNSTVGSRLSTNRGGGRSTPGTTGSTAIWPTFGSSTSARCSPSHTRPSRSRTPCSGRRTPTRRPSSTPRPRGWARTGSPSNRSMTSPPGCNARYTWCTGPMIGCARRRLANASPN